MASDLSVGERVFKNRLWSGRVAQRTVDTESPHSCCVPMPAMGVSAGLGSVGSGHWECRDASPQSQVAFIRSQCKCLTAGSEPITSEMCRGSCGMEMNMCFISLPNPTMTPCGQLHCGMF